MKYAAVALHFDSLGEAYGFPQDYHDPTFFEIADRLFDVSDRQDFRYSIFLIGRDLEKPENRSAVASWSRNGHEVGNHSFTHPFNFGSMSRERIKAEVRQTHDLITETIGREPMGFAAPAWSSSRTHMSVLSELGYRYDASLFPSWLRYLTIPRLMAYHWGTRRALSALNQKHLLVPLVGRRHAFVGRDGLVELPLPTNRMRVACWHTLAFQFGWKAHENLLRHCLEEVDAFYYVVHPADLICEDSLRTDAATRLARLDVPLATKKEYFNRAIALIKQSGRQIITMRELADRIATN